MKKTDLEIPAKPFGLVHYKNQERLRICHQEGLLERKGFGDNWMPVHPHRSLNNNDTYKVKNPNL
jgi:hypothetical protein